MTERVKFPSEKIAPWLPYTPLNTIEIHSGIPGLLQSGALYFTTASSTRRMAFSAVSPGRRARSATAKRPSAMP